LSSTHVGNTTLAVSAGLLDLCDIASPHSMHRVLAV